MEIQVDIRRGGGGGQAEIRESDLSPFSRYPNSSTRECGTRGGGGGVVLKH